MLWLIDTINIKYKNLDIKLIKSYIHKDKYSKTYWRNKKYLKK
jgi:hypothetical protein